MSRTLTGIRPSLWARCVTAAVFQGRGATEAEPEPETREWFFRGHVFEEIVMRQIEAKHGKENVQRQVVIPIPGIGEGHADGYLVPEKALIEVKSTVAAYPNSDTFQFGVEQLRRYIAYHPEAEKGYLYMVDPGRMKPADVYTVTLTDDERDHIEAERQTIVELAGKPRAQLADHGSHARPCARPSQARGRLCPFAEACFAGWEEPAPGEVTDPEALRLAQRVRDIELAEREHKAALKETEEEKRAAKLELSEYVPEKGKTIVGPFQVQTWPVRGQVKVSARALQAAGINPEPYSTRGTDRVEVRVGMAGEPGDVDFGDAPF